MEWDNALLIAAIPVTISVLGIIYQAWANRTRGVAGSEIVVNTIEAATEMIEQLRKARDYWRKRAIDCEEKRDRMKAKGE